jgi:hypothetical protein
MPGKGTARPRGVHDGDPAPRAVTAPAVTVIAMDGATGATEPHWIGRVDGSEFGPGATGATGAGTAVPSATLSPSARIDGGVHPEAPDPAHAYQAVQLTKDTPSFAVHSVVTLVDALAPLVALLLMLRTGRVVLAATLLLVQRLLERLELVLLRLRGYPV